MKIQEEPVDEVTEALKAFFERKGGHQAVAKMIEVNPQQLYYIISGRNAPTLKTVMRILRYYPNERILREALSLPMPEFVDVPQAMGQGSDLHLQQELDRKEQELEKARAKIEQLQNEIQESAKDFRQLSLNFPYASSQFTPISTEKGGPMNLMGQLGIIESSANNWGIPVRK